MAQRNDLRQKLVTRRPPLARVDDTEFPAMHAATLLKVGLVSWVLGTCWTRPLDAASNCVAVLSIEGPHQTVSRMRQALEKGRLRGTSAENCRRTFIYLEERNSYYQIQFTHDDSTIVRDVKSPEIAAIWVESWLVPATTIDPPTHPPSVAAEPPASSAAPISQAKGYGFALEFGLSMMGAIGSTWLGPAARVHTRLAEGWWLEPGADLDYAITQTPADTARATRVFVGVGRDVVRTGSWLVRPGCSVGVDSLLWRDTRVATHVSGPSLGAGVLAGYAITNTFSLVARAEISLALADRVESARKRVYFDNDSNDSERVDIVTTERHLEPTWVGALGLGVLIHLGDSS